MKLIHFASLVSKFSLISCTKITLHGTERKNSISSAESGSPSSADFGTSEDSSPKQSCAVCFGTVNGDGIKLNPLRGGNCKHEFCDECIKGTVDADRVAKVNYTRYSSEGGLTRNDLAKCPCPLCREPFDGTQYVKLPKGSDIDVLCNTIVQEHQGSTSDEEVLFGELPFLPRARYNNVPLNPSKRFEGTIPGTDFDTYLGSPPDLNANEQLKNAVNAWGEGGFSRRRVVDHYGPMSEWDVSEVTDMSSLFFMKEDHNLDQKIDFFDLHFEEVEEIRRERETEDSDSELFEITNDDVFRRPVEKLQGWSREQVITSLWSYMFNEDLSKWNTGSVTDMSQMFQNCLSFNSNLSNWKVNKVKSFEGMFKNAQNFNNEDNSEDSESSVTEGSSGIQNWDTSSATTMNSMFNEARRFNQPLSHWSTTQVTSMESMFKLALSFDQPLKTQTIYVETLISESSPESKVIGDESDLKNYIKSRNSTRSKIKINLMISRAFNKLWNTNTNDIRFSSSDNQGRYLEFKKYLAWDVSNVETFYSTFYQAQIFNQDLTSWQVSNKVTTVEHMFQEALNFNNGQRFVFADQESGLLEIVNGGDSSSSEESSPENDGSLKSFSHWDLSNVESATSMFANAHSFNGDVSGWFNTNHNNRVTDLKYMFHHAYSFNGEIGSWDVSTVTTTEAMFQSAISFQGNDLAFWNVANVKDMSSMFKETGNFNCDLSDWELASVRNMSMMFKEAKKFDNFGKSLKKKWQFGTLLSNGVQLMEMDTKEMFEKCPNFPHDHRPTVSSAAGRSPQVIGRISRFFSSGRLNVLTPEEAEEY